MAAPYGEGRLHLERRLAAFVDGPLDAYTDQALSLADLWGDFAFELSERLQAVTDVQARLKQFESLLRQQQRPGVRSRDMFTLWAIGRLAERGISVGSVQRDSGLSATTFIARFRATIGLTPKRYCELLRLRQAVELGHARHSWSEAAMAAGYADQAHLTREFRRFTDLTPGVYRRSATAFPMHVAAG